MSTGKMKVDGVQEADTRLEPPSSFSTALSFAPWRRHRSLLGFGANVLMLRWRAVEGGYFIITSCQINKTLVDRKGKGAPGLDKKT